MFPLILDWKLNFCQMINALNWWPQDINSLRQSSILGSIPNSHCVQTRSRLPGTAWRGLIFFTTDVHTIFSNAPTFRGQSRLSGFGCALDHSATTCRACAHLMKTAVRYQLRAQGRSFVPGPNKFGWITLRSPGEHPHYGIAGESPT